MGTLAGALGRGLAGYGANRERADQRDAELAQQARAEQRQGMLDERQRAQMDAQAQAMKEQRERNAAEDARRGEMDQRDNYERGYRPQGDTQREAGAVREAAPSLSGMGPTSPLLTMGASTMATGLDRRANEAPAFTMQGQPMVKSAMSLAERTAEAQVKESNRKRTEDRGWQVDDNTQDRGWQVADNAQRETRQDVRDARNRADRREPGVNMQVIQTADGPMAFNPRTGETKPITANGRQVQGASEGRTPNTDGARKAAGFLLRMEGATKTFDQLEPANTTDPKEAAKMSGIRSNIGQAILGKVPFVGDQWERSTYSESQGAYDTAKRDFLAAMLRKESGAQINASEWDEGNRRYFSVRGDTPAIALQKRKNREQAMQAAEIEAGIRPVRGGGQNMPDVNTDAIRTQAVNAIRRGADPAAVRKRYEETTRQRWED